MESKTGRWIVNDALGKLSNNGKIERIKKRKN
jgi:hypothetical protein